MAMNKNTAVPKGDLVVDLGSKNPTMCFKI